MSPCRPVRLCYVKHSSSPTHFPVNSSYFNVPGLLVPYAWIRASDGEDDLVQAVRRQITQAELICSHFSDHCSVAGSLVSRKLLLSIFWLKNVLGKNMNLDYTISVNQNYVYFRRQVRHWWGNAWGLKEGHVENGDILLFSNSALLYSPTLLHRHGNNTHTLSGTLNLMWEALNYSKNVAH